MKTLLLTIPAAALAVALLTTSAPICTAQMGCGIKPIKPIKPIGCDDLVAQCMCDSRGQNCRWEWVCVKRR